MKCSTAVERWLALDGDRRSFLTRCEQYALYTIPRVCPKDGARQETQEMNHDWQALGAQGVNHLANRLTLTLFAPSRPFVRFEMAPKALAAAITALGTTEEKLQELLSVSERQAVALLDQKGCRPQIYEALRHLIIVGNILLCLDTDTLRVLGLKNYVVRRSMTGKVIEIVTREQMKCSELLPEIREAIPEKRDEDSVCLYRWICRDDMGDMRMTVWVDEVKLPEEFNGKWPEDECPYRPLTWDLMVGNHYGSPYVEDYAGDFAALQVLSKAMVEGGVLSSEFRWVLNPSSQMMPEDFMRTANGGVVPGQAGDLTMVSASNTQALQTLQAIASVYERRIGRAFLLNSAVTRDAERVTAEEMRAQITELETGLGGAYTRIAIDFQRPVAFWLLREMKVGLNGSQIQPTIITGLDALSRNGDLENVKSFLADVAQVTSLPPEIRQYLRMSQVLSALATGRGIESGKYVLTDQQVQEAQAAMAQQVPQGAPIE